MNNPDRAIRIEPGDCLEVMARLKAEGVTVDAVATDPPYHLTIAKRFGAVSVDSDTQTSERSRTGADGYGRLARGFMGKAWDGGDIAFRAETWRLAFDLLKPGGHLVAFSGTRTYHRMACAIEDAGFEVRDQLGWVYASGFPKSHNVAKGAGSAICRCPSGDDPLRGMREGQDDTSGVASEGKNADMLAPMQWRSTRSGVGCAWSQRAEGENEGVVSECRNAGSEESRMERRRDLPEAPGKLRERPLCPMSGGSAADGAAGRLCDGASADHGADRGAPTSADGSGPPSGPCAIEQCADQPGIVALQPEPQAGRAWPLCRGCGKPVIPDGLGTALKPSWEPIILARKPLIGTVVENVLRHGTGAINVDSCRVSVTTADSRDVGRTINRNVRSADDGYGMNRGAAEKVPSVVRADGRWPANILHDGSDEVMAAFPQTESGVLAAGTIRHQENRVYGKGMAAAGKAATLYDTGGDSGSAARFFYTAKADEDDRLGSKHPTVKPVSLMRWLVRLITPPGGTVLDPFSGSGTTAHACIAERFGCIAIEREAEYLEDIRRRVEYAQGRGPLRERAVNARFDESKAKGDDTPLFGGAT